MANQVSAQILAAVYARLSDPTTGFNAGMTAQLPLYGFTDNFAVIDWSEGSSGFCFDQIDPADLDKSGLATYPFVCLYILDSLQAGLQKFAQFSGPIRCVLDITLSWNSMNGVYNRESYSCCVEDVVFDIINRVSNQNWGEPLVYNGVIQCRRAPTVFGANNWRKRLTFSMTFEIHQ
jgi:hypothetical protein